MITTSSLVPDEMLPGFKGSSLDSYDSPLDRQRAASMADEGGVSAAETDAIEQQMSATGAPRERSASTRVRSGWGFVWGLAAAVVTFQAVMRFFASRTRGA
jgi:hypothetical protein